MDTRIRVEVCAALLLMACAGGASRPPAGSPAPPAASAAPPAAAPVAAASEPAPSESEPPAGPALRVQGTPRALLIGINDYLEVPDLRGALNDIALIRELLITRYGFRDADIEVVTDAQATRVGILAALDRLVERTQPGDTVYLHYSGHGSQVRDANSDEADGIDETLVPHDGRTPGVADISDDELAQSLARLRADNVVIVLDSCHSGTATRGFVQPRAVPRDTRDELYAGVATRAVVPLVKANHVLFTGASSDQQALDGPVDGQLHGLFTYALARSLSSAPAGATPREVLAGAERELERVKAQLGLPSMPEPQLEAEEQRLGSAFLAASAASETPARLPWVEVRPEAAGLRLVGARALGAAVGSLWAVYPPGELDFAVGKALAQARVTELRGDDALARATPQDAAIEAGARAALLAPPEASGKIEVRLDDPDAARAGRLRAALQSQLPDLVFVGENEFARFVLEPDGGALRVLAADARSEVARFETAKESELVGALVLLLRRWSTAADLLALDNPMASIRLELDVEGAPPRREPRPPERGVAVVADTSARRYRIRKPDEPRSAQNSLQLRVEASAPCYLSVVDVDSQGNLNLLFPNPISEQRGWYPDGKIGAGERVLIPDSLQSGNRAGFYFDYGPPPGTDTVRAFCAADRAVAVSLRAAIASLSAPATGTRGVGADPVRTALRGSLRDSLSAVASRGIALVADAPAPAVAPEPSAPAPAPPKPVPPPVAVAAPDWTAASLTLDIAE